MRQLSCGSSVQASCRDLARAAQLLLNDGFWPGAGQLVDRDYALESSRMIYPESGAATNTPFSCSGKASILCQDPHVTYTRVCHRWLKVGQI
jgi:hypothetical protein